MPQPTPFVYGQFWPGNPAPAQAGQCLVNGGNGVWYPYLTFAGSFPGGQIGIAIETLMPGASGAIQVHGIIDPNVFNLGSGSASPVTPGAYPARGSGLAIGSCDTTGLICLVPSYGTSTSNGTLGGYSLPSAAPVSGQAPIFSSSGWSYGAAGNSAPKFVTDLTTFAPSSPSLRITLTIDGYRASGDGGGGQFAWVQGSFTSDGGSIIVPTGSSGIGAWCRILPRGTVLDCRWYGAVGDGVTDDAPALQNWANAGNTLGLPGLHLSSNPLTPAAATKYYASKPIFLNYEATLTQDPGVILFNRSTFCDYFVAGNAFATAPTFATVSTASFVGTYMQLDQNGGFDLSDSVASNISGWGHGNDLHTAANFTQPALLGTVSGVLVNSTSGLPSSCFAYVQGGGLYFLTVVDLTHINLQWFGQTTNYDVASGTILSGAQIGVASNSIQGGELAPGLTIEGFIDPVSNWAVGASNGLIACSNGSLDGATATSAVQVYCYNDQASPQTRVGFLLKTTGSGSTTIKSGATTLTAGQLTHFAATYDGINTMSLYLGGTRVATATVTGTIIQNWWERFGIGEMQTSISDNTLAGSLVQSVKLAQIRISPVAMYSGSSFTPPTSLTPPPSIGGVMPYMTWLDFASHQSVTGPGGSDYGQGWVQALTTFFGDRSFQSTWLVWTKALHVGYTNYATSPKFRKLNFDVIGRGIMSHDSLRGAVDDCVFGVTLTPYQGFALLGFSYNWRSQGCIVNAMGTPRPVGRATGALVIDGSQYAVIDGRFFSGGNWQVISNAPAWLTLKQFWTQTTAVGGICIDSRGGAPCLHILQVALQDDGGLPPIGYQRDSHIHIYGVQNVVIELGYTVLDIVWPTSIALRGCKQVYVRGMLHTHIAPTTFDLTNQTTPVHVEGAQAFLPETFAGLTAHVINGSSTVQLSGLSPDALFVGACFYFASEPNSLYLVTAWNSSLIQITLHANYGGTTNAATAITWDSTAWMPETGHTGQGPLHIKNLEDSSFRLINVIATATQRMLVNDFMYGSAEVTDTDSLISGVSLTMLLPLIAGYRRTYFNNTAKSIIFQGSTNGTSGTGGSVTIATGKTAQIQCDGSNWLRMSPDA